MKSLRGSCRMSLTKPELVAAIIRDAGNQIIGGTRLQKIAYLLDVVGYGDGFHFLYKHIGPYSEGVADSAMTGALLDHIAEEERQAEWGGVYSIYSVSGQSDDSVPIGRRKLACQANKSGPVTLELAATAVFLSVEGYSDPWSETARRKPLKIKSGRLERAKKLLAQLRKIEVPKPLPDFD